MIARKVSSDCHWVLHSLDVYSDGELDPGHAVDVESHLSDCSSCREALESERATRQSLKRVVRCSAPEALRAKVAAQMMVERDEAALAVSDNESEPQESGRLIKFRYAAALAAAAGVALAFGASRGSVPVTPGETNTVVEANVGIDSILDELVDLHAHPLPPETTDPDDLGRFEPLVGVPVPRGKSFQPLGGEFRGGRVNRTRERSTAILQYQNAGKHRITVYVFNSKAIPLRMPTRRLEERVVKERPVYVGNVGGYWVAAVERSGVGYAVASDIGADQSAAWIASVP